MTARPHPSDLAAVQAETRASRLIALLIVLSNITPATTATITGAK